MLYIVISYILHIPHSTVHMNKFDISIKRILSIYMVGSAYEFMSALENSFYQTYSYRKLSVYITYSNISIKRIRMIMSVLPCILVRYMHI